MKEDNKEVYLLHKQPKMIFVILGLILIIQGIFRLFGSGMTVINLVLGILLMLFGAGCLVYALLNYSIKSQKAGRVELSDKIFLIKQDFFKKPIAIEWDNIQAIDLGDYTLGFKKNDQMYYIKYNTKKDISEEIKNALRRYAENKGIAIVTEN